MSIALEVVLLGSAATGFVFHTKLDPVKKKSDEVSQLKASNETAKRGQLRDSMVPLSSQA